MKLHNCFPVTGAIFRVAAQKAIDTYHMGSLKIQNKITTHQIICDLSYGFLPCRLARTAYELSLHTFVQIVTNAMKKATSIQ